MHWTAGMPRRTALGLPVVPDVKILRGTTQMGVSHEGTQAKSVKHVTMPCGVRSVPALLHCLVGIYITGHEISLQASFKMCEEIAYWHLLTVNVSRSSLGLTILLLFSSFRSGEIYVEGLPLLLIPFARQKTLQAK